MTELYELTKEFKASRPIFLLTMEREDRTISGNQHDPVHQYTPEPDLTNPLSVLVCDHYHETFNIKYHKFVINRKDIAERAMAVIRNSFSTFIEEHLDMKSPRQSKLYRWFDNDMPSDIEFNDALVMMYKYMRTFCDKRMKSSNTAHINNTLALLQAVMEKYE